MTPEERFNRLPKIPPLIILPDNTPFRLFTISDDLIYLSGHGPGWGNDFSVNVGKIGSDLSIEEGIKAAETCMLNLLCTTRNAIGSLNNVMSVLEVFGMVNCDQDFKDHSQVINGASNLLIEVFGEKGKHSRVAMGCSSLPFNFSVEIKMTMKIKHNK